MGILSGAGIGGGSLLVLWLTYVMGESIESARLIVLLFFIPCAAISCFLRNRQSRLPLKLCLPAMVTGCITAVLFSQISASWNTDTLRKLWGVVLCIAAVKELCWKRKQRNP